MLLSFGTLRQLLQDLLFNRLRNFHPTSNKVNFSGWFITLHQRANSTPLLMSHDNNTLHIERLNGKLNRRTDTMLMRCLVTGRNQISHIPDDKNVTWITIK